eukprot:755346_1
MRLPYCVSFSISSFLLFRNGVEGVDTEYCHWEFPNKKACKYHHYEKGLIHLVKDAGAEIWPSIGGWSLSDPFPVMAKNPTSRANFATKCIELIEDYGFDGIDIDWEVSLLCHV